jgi:hypothetical protein
VHPWEKNLQEHDVEGGSLGCLHGGRSVRGDLGFVPKQAEQHCCALSIVRVAFRDEHAESGRIPARAEAGGPSEPAEG